MSCGSTGTGLFRSKRCFYRGLLVQGLTPGSVEHRRRRSNAEIPGSDGRHESDGRSRGGCLVLGVTPGSDYQKVDWGLVQGIAFGSEGRLGLFGLGNDCWFRR